MNILEGFSKTTQFVRSQARKALFEFQKPEESLGRIQEKKNVNSIEDFEMMLDGGDDRFEPSPRGPPLTRGEWESYFDAEGRINREAEREIRRIIFYGGIEPSLRKEVWKYLVGYYPFGSSYAEREFLLHTKREEYKIYRAQWATITLEQETHYTKFVHRRHRIEKDVVRTDRSLPFFAGGDNPNVQVLQEILLTYIFFNQDIGYVQGMNDFLSPMLVIMNEECEAFWCFKFLMDQMMGNFHKDQMGMQNLLTRLGNVLRVMDPELFAYLKTKDDCANLFFCYRWMLILFKREFPFHDTLRLWEILWSEHLAKDFHLFVAAGILMKHRQTMFSEEMEFDSILKLVNDLSGHLNVDEVISDAEVLHKKFQKEHLDSLS